MADVLVSGATGNVGTQVVAQLLARGERVRAAVRRGREAEVAGEQWDPRPVLAPLDFEAPDTFAGALDGVDRVFLMRPPHLSDARTFRPFVEAMEGAGIGRVVFLSVQGAGQNVFVPHHGIERLLKRSSLDWTFLRPSFFMQNLTTTHLADIRDQDEIYVPAGNGRTNFIDIADIAEVAALCLTSPGHTRKAYEITGSEALTYAEVAQLVSRACGRPIDYKRPSPKDFKLRMKAAGHDDDYVRVTGRIYAIARFGMAAGTTDTFERIVGRKPRTFLDWAVANAAEWSR